MRATPAQNMLRIDILEKQMGEMRMLMQGFLHTVAIEYTPVHRGYNRWDVLGPPNGHPVNAEPLDKEGAWKLATDMQTATQAMRAEDIPPVSIPDSDAANSLDVDEDTPPDGPPDGSEVGQRKVGAMEAIADLPVLGDGDINVKPLTT
jgi:hypothetical protein